MTVKEWYSASELAGLPGMPGTVQGTLKRAKTKKFTSRHAIGRKGSDFAFSDLPDETKDHLRPVTRRDPREVMSAEAVSGPATGTDGRPMAIKDWYSAAELAGGHGLPGLAATKSGVIRQARREGWTFRPRKGRGGGREYLIASLPQPAQAHLRGIADREQCKEAGQPIKSINTQYLRFQASVLSRMVEQSIHPIGTHYLPLTRVNNLLPIVDNLLLLLMDLKQQLRSGK